jgi:hypothetical protein
MSLRRGPRCRRIDSPAADLRLQINRTSPARALGQIRDHPSQLIVRVLILVWRRSWWGCFDTQASASPAASKPTTANAIGPATREQFKEFAKCWKIRRFSNDLDYQAMNVTWHSMPGYYVRKSIKGKITVFAKLDQVAPSGLEGFIFPDNPNLFSATGELCGMEYAP